jgi:hypothetical protein
VIAAQPPDLTVYSDAAVTELTHFAGDPLSIDLSLGIGASRAPLTLIARRGRDRKIHISQVLRRGRERITRATALSASSFPSGIDNFARIRVRTLSGQVVASGQVPFCPNGGGLKLDELDPQIPDTPSFPPSCGHALSRFVYWGIDRGWAASLYASLPTDGSLPDGRYRAEVTIDPRRRLADANRANNTRTFLVRVRTTQPDSGPGPFVGKRTRRSLPPGTALPNLRALPSSGISTSIDGKHDLLSFGAMVWNDGPGTVIVEGRRKTATTMTANQVLRAGDLRVRVPIGTLVYDPLDGHNHWHYNDLARYRLLDGNGTIVRRSDKVGFCFLGTDPIDLSVPHASLAPDQSTYSGCGRRYSFSVRMRLPVGWGDFYSQSVAGQAFDITHLPNGRYWIQVLVNVTGKLVERTSRDNDSLRLVILGGKAGDRTVAVPPVNGVDTETFGGPASGRG